MGDLTRQRFQSNSFLGFLTAAAVLLAGLGVSLLQSQTGYGGGPAALSVTTATPLPAGKAGVAYSLSFAATGGTPPYSWLLNAGTPPLGLTLNSAGVFSGTPTASGNFSFTVQVNDSAGGKAILTVILVIAPGSAPASSTVITTFSGSGTPAFAGDTGLATSASLYQPIGLALDSAGNLYIGDSANNRVRKVTPAGIISTVAGNGTAAFSGDNGPATAASLNGPEGVAVDTAGNLYIADYGNNRIRMVSPAGIITTFAGGGTVFPDPSAGGSATQAQLYSPTGVAVDSAGNVYIADYGSGNLRRVQSGLIQSYLWGAAGPVQPTSVAVDATGNLYVADFGNSRVLQISPSNVITRFAGNGTAGFSGDGGAATAASLNHPFGVTLDSAGNLYIADELNNRIRKVTAGMISTVAGNGTAGFSGDGGAATAASLRDPLGVALDSAGNLYVADYNNNRIREVLPSSPVISATPLTFNFNGLAGGAPGAPQPLYVSAASTNVPVAVPDATSVPFTASVATNDGANWLSVDATSGVTPRTLHVVADPTTLTRGGSYTGHVNIQSSGASGGPISIPVAFTVGAGGSTALAVDQTNLTFTYPAGAAASSQQVLVRNVSVGTLNFTTATNTSWLTLTPTTGAATPITPVALAVTANPAGMTAGIYKGSFTVTAGASIVVPVIMNVSASPPGLILSQTGLTFIAVRQGGVVPPQNLSILNLGTVNLSPTVAASTLTGGNWLIATPAGASSVSVSIDPNVVAGMAPGPYSGLVTVSSPGVANSPQVATVLLQVLPVGTEAPASLLPNESTFPNISNDSYNSQSVSIFNPTSSAKAFYASSADPYVSVSPQTGAVMPGQPMDITISSSPAGLATGVHHSSVSLQFDDGVVRVLRVTTIASGVSPGIARGRRPFTSAACPMTQLVPAILSLGSGFAVPVGWPVAIQASVQDDCGNPVTSGSVTAEFSNGDPAVSLRSVRGGLWDGTWPTNASSNGVTVTLVAVLGQFTGTDSVTGSFSASEEPPVITSAVVGANGQLTITGTLLSETGVLATALPPPSTNLMLGDTSALLGRQQMVLQSTAPTQIQAMIPSTAAANTPQQVIVVRGAQTAVAPSFRAATTSPTLPLAYSLPYSVSYSATATPPPPPPSSPVISSLSPSSVVAGSGAFTLTVNGSNFSADNVVNFGGVNLATSFATATQLTAQVPASSVAVAASVQVMVMSASSGTSNAVTFTVNPAAPTNCTFNLTPPSGSYQVSGGTGSFNVSTQAGCTAGTIVDDNWIHLTSSTSPAGGGSIDYTVDANAGPAGRSSIVGITNSSGAIVGTYEITQTGIDAALSGLTFISLPPCRVMDTRTVTSPPFSGPFGPPSLTAGQPRTIIPSQSVCNVPPTAKAYVTNITLIPQQIPGRMNAVTIYPSEEEQPRYTTASAADTNTVANAAIIRAGAMNGAITVASTDTMDMLIDISGYFTDAAASKLVFYPVNPCRAVETRAAARGPGPFGGPSMAAGETRTYIIPSSPYCGIPPSGVAAYSMTVTVVPQGPLFYLTTWPAGTPQPVVSSLNSFDGRTVANSVIVPASPSGGIQVYTSNATDFFIDINGYFAPGNGFSYYPVTQCTVSNSADGLYSGAFGGPVYLGGARSIAVPGSPFCAAIPSSALGYAANVTANPHGNVLGYVTLYPTGSPVPNASMLNDFQKQVITNSAIVPAGPNGSIDVLTNGGPADIQLMISGYFAR